MPELGVNTGPPASLAVGGGRAVHEGGGIRAGCRARDRVMLDGFRHRFLRVIIRIRAGGGLPPVRYPDDGAIRLVLTAAPARGTTSRLIARPPRPGHTARQSCFAGPPRS